MSELSLSDCILEEYKDNPELHIKKLKIKLKQIKKLDELFSKALMKKYSEDNHSLIGRIEKLLEQYKEEYPEYFL